MQNAPQSEVVHDAVYYSGLAFAKLGQCDKSLAYFKALLKPDSGAPDRYKKQATKQIETLEKDAGKICTDKQSEDEGTPGRACRQLIEGECALGWPLPGPRGGSRA